MRLGRLHRPSPLAPRVHDRKWSPQPRPHRLPNGLQTSAMPWELARRPTTQLAGQNISTRYPCSSVATFRPDIRVCAAVGVVPLTASLDPQLISLSRKLEIWSLKPFLLEEESTPMLEAISFVLKGPTLTNELHALSHTGVWCSLQTDRPV